MRLHGISRDVFDRYRSTRPSWQYEVVAPGYKYNLTDPAAAMGRVRARTTLRPCGIVGPGSPRPTMTPLLTCRSIVRRTQRSATSMLGTCMSCDSSDAPAGRDNFIEQMAHQRVGCSVRFIPLHKHPYWRTRYGLSDPQFPVASQMFERVVSLPLFSSMTDSQVSAVVAAVRKVLT